MSTAANKKRSAPEPAAKPKGKATAAAPSKKKKVTAPSGKPAVPDKRPAVADEEDEEDAAEGDDVDETEAAAAAPEEKKEKKRRAPVNKGGPKKPPKRFDAHSPINFLDLQIYWKVIASHTAGLRRALAALAKAKEADDDDAIDTATSAVERYRSLLQREEKRRDDVLAQIQAIAALSPYAAAAEALLATMVASFTPPAKKPSKPKAPADGAAAAADAKPEASGDAAAKPDADAGAAPKADADEADEAADGSDDGEGEDDDEVEVSLPVQ